MLNALSIFPLYEAFVPWVPDIRPRRDLRGVISSHQYLSTEFTSQSSP